MSDFDLGGLEVTNGGLDAFLGSNAEVITPASGDGRVAAVATEQLKKTGRVKVGSLAQLDGFVRTAEDMLVHKSNRDLWALRQDRGGEFYIERMFDDLGLPLKG